LVTAAAACSSGSKKTTSSTSSSLQSSLSSSQRSSSNTPPPPAPDSDWVGQGPKPLSNLVSAGGHIVYIGVDHNEPSLVGLDPTTGAVVWQRPDSLGYHLSGVEERLVVDGDNVFDLESDSNAAQSKVAFTPDAARAQASGSVVVAVNAANGKDVWSQSVDGEASTPFVNCDGALCVSAVVTPNHLTINRLAFADGSVASTGDKAFDPLVVINGAGAVSASRDTSNVTLTDQYGQQVTWTHTRTELFGTDDVTPDGGWGGGLVDGVWIVWLGGPQQPTPSFGVIAGISATGDRLWTLPDAALCPIFTEVDEETVPISCGQLDVTGQTYTTGTIARIDAATGKPAWSLDAGDIDAVKPGDAIVRFDATNYALALPSGDVTLNTDTGPGGPPATKSGWCVTQDDEVGIGEDRSLVTASWAPCTLGVGPDDTPPAAVPGFAGPTIGGHGAWVEDGQVRGVRVR
jgi:hypothetical protein